MFIQCIQYNANCIYVCWLHSWNCIPALQFIIHAQEDVWFLGREKEGYSMLLQGGILKCSVMGYLIM
jgi:hypothetical protein